MMLLGPKINYEIQGYLTPRPGIRVFWNCRTRLVKYFKTQIPWNVRLKRGLRVEKKENRKYRQSSKTQRNESLRRGWGRVAVLSVFPVLYTLKIPGGTRLPDLALTSILDLRLFQYDKRPVRRETQDTDCLSVRLLPPPPLDQAGLELRNSEIRQPPEWWDYWGCIV
jgi:hypothetical protein